MYLNANTYQLLSNKERKQYIFKQTKIKNKRPHLLLTKSRFSKSNMCDRGKTENVSDLTLRQNR